MLIALWVPAVFILAATVAKCVIAYDSVGDDDELMIRVAVAMIVLGFFSQLLF